MIINILINFLLITIFITIFFFTYAANIESVIIKDQMKYFADDIYNDVSLMGKPIQKMVLNNITNMKTPDFTEENNKIKTQNKTTITNALIATVVLTVLVIGIVYFLYGRSDDINLFEIIICNFIILLFVALTEYSFLTFYASKYISINPNKVKSELFSQINKTMQILDQVNNSPIK